MASGSDTTTRGTSSPREVESRAGFDGTWVAHPDLVPVAMVPFNSVLGDRPNQLDRSREDVTVGAADLLNFTIPGGEVTEDGLRNDVAVGLRYLAAWLAGSGAVGIFNLMEDAATAEIARAQVWQWVRNGAFDAPTVRRVLDEEVDRARAEVPGAFDWEAARRLFEQVALADEFVEFLTLPAYDVLA